MKLQIDKVHVVAFINGFQMFSLLSNCGIIENYLDHVAVNLCIHLQHHIFKINPFCKYTPEIF